MTLRTSLIITGDTAGAQKAVADLARSMDQAGAAAEGLAASERVAEAATEGLQNELHQSVGALGAIGAGTRSAGDGFGALATRAGAVEGQLVRATVAGRNFTRSAAEQAQGARMFGQQLQDMAVMGSMAGDSMNNWVRVFTSQIGQVALAAEQMGAKGALGEAAAFMNTPWGAAVSGAAIVLLPLAVNLLTTGDNAEALEKNLQDAASASDAFGDAQSLLGKILDLTTGKLKTQNLVLVESIKLQAQLNLVKAQEKIDGLAGTKKPTGYARFDSLPENDLRRVAGPSAQDMYAQMAADLPNKAQLSALRDQLVRQLNNDSLAKSNPSQYASVVGGQLGVINQQLDAMATNGKIAGRSLIEVKTEFLDLANTGVQKAAAMEVISAAATGNVPDDLKPYSRDKKTRTPKGRSAANHDEYGRSAADRIAAITAAFDATPTAVQLAEKAIRQLDDLIGGLGRKKPPNFGALISSAEQAKKVVETGLIRSIGEAFEKPQTLADKAVKAFQTLDAELAKKSAMLKDGLIDQAGFDAFASKVGAAKSQIENGLNRPYEEFIRQQQETLQIQGLISLGRNDEAEALRQIITLERSRGTLDQEHRDAILASTQAIRAEQRATEELHERNQKNVEALGSIKAAVTDATQAFVRGDLGQFIKTPKKLLDAFMTLQGQKLFDRLFSDMFRELEDEVNGTTVVKDASERMVLAVDRASGSLSKLENAALGAANAVGGTPWVSGVRGGADGLGMQSLFGSGTDMANAIVVSGTRLNKQLDIFVRGIGGVADKLAGIFTNPENARAIGKAIGTFAGKGLEGAATGTMIAGLGNALGIKMSSTGSAVGGAIGNFLPVPGGSIIGSIAGGLIGGLFTKPAYGTASLSNANSAASLRGRAGAELGAGSAAQQVQTGLQSIAEQLGGALGNFAVSIGTFDGKWRVSTTGFGGQLDSKTARGQGLHDFGKDGEQAAIAFAIQDAIADGAITGLSAAVQQAIRSNPDMNKALQEALKVADVEKLLGGLPAQLTSAFRDFEKQAADRVRIARQYGFDVVKIEEINAKERLNLQKQLLDQQVGSLQRLVDEMTSGSLFEGTSVDRRTALLADIDKAKADLTNGVDGAADKLATLFDQLNAVSKDVYGTTGGFATDRSAILDQARAAIAKANADIAAAQAQARGSDPALATTNAALDENNDQNARMIDALRESNALLARLGQLGVQGFNLTELARTS